MIMEDNIIKIYTGTIIDAEFIAKLMEDNSIAYLVRDLGRESRIAGWTIDISPYSSFELYVFEKDYDKAKKLIDELEEAPFDESEMGKEDKEEERKD